jgi:hypothetical protein
MDELQRMERIRKAGWATAFVGILLIALGFALPVSEHLEAWLLIVILPGFILVMIGAFMDNYAKIMLTGGDRYAGFISKASAVKNGFRYPLVWFALAFFVLGIVVCLWVAAGGSGSLAVNEHGLKVGLGLCAVGLGLIVWWTKAGE